VDVFIGAGKEHFTNRKDERDLLAELHKKGYQVSSNIDEITGVKAGKLAGFLTETPAHVRGDQLTRTSLTAIDILKQNRKGFFLMIEGSKIDDGGHGNDLDVVINEMIDFDNAIGKVLEFAERDGNTLVIITGDHETGGLTLTGGRLGGKIEGRFSTKGHTAVMVPVFAYGPGAESFMGIYHNNTIFDKMKEAFKF
jgi:alkaline phosphatase